MAAGPIPASSIARHTADWAYDDALAFRICMRAMDEVFLEPREKPGRVREVANGEDRLRTIFGDRID